MENQENTAQPNQAAQPSEPQSPKEIEIEEKRDKFYKKIKLIALGTLILISSLILIALVRSIYNKTKEAYVVSSETGSTLPGQEIIITEESPIEVEKWEIYSSEKYRFSFDYPKGDGLFVSNLSAEEFLVEIRSSNIVPDENPDGENLVKGYIFRVTPLRLATSDLEIAANAKRDWYLSYCPETSTISQATGRTTAQMEAVGFDITDCNSDYSITYITANDFVYEVMQIYKGDLGFEQIYKSRTNQILSSLVIDVDLPELSPTVTYQNKALGFSFEYPRGMDTQCCVVPAPPQDNTKTLIILAENDNSDAIGFFYSHNNYGTDAYDLIENQRMKLSDEYAIVKNKVPDGTQTELTISGQRAIVLSGYSWRGNDLIFIPMPNKKNVLTISKMNVSDETFNTIVESFKLK